MNRKDLEERRYDELLVVLIRSGDRRAAERLAVRWYPRLLRTARRLLGDDDQAREAVQEAWTGICRGWLRLREVERFPAWAFGILHRKCADRIRTSQDQRGRFEPLGDAMGASPATGEDRYSIDQALSRLGDEHRAAAVLYFGEGLTLAEMAAATGVPLGTAKSRIFHARRQLKAALKGDDS